ncbi:MAG TPA: glycosyltransferase [Candidatus Binataceae bacterium]|nr:glycosyltransferase [Candidatus Binataceae bacterium]
MRVLAHVHTFNDAEFVERALDAIRRQTRPPDAILVVDNASTDGTLDKASSKDVAVVRNSTNLGMGGAIGIGFARALEQKFDWTWIVEPDGVPEPDALEKLLGFFERLPPLQKEQVYFLACRLGTGEKDYAPILLSEAGLEFLSPNPNANSCRCDCFLWAGSLFRMPAVAKIGMPSPDYFADLSELEFGYRAQQLGFTGYVVNASVLHHNLGRPAGYAIRLLRLGPLSFPLFETSPLRAYYYPRNLLYFWMYQFRPYRPRLALRSIVHALVYTAGFAVRPVSHRRQLMSCLRGLRDGLTAHIERRY